MYVINVFVISAVISGLYAQEKKDCLSEPVITESVECITNQLAAKFEDIINELDLPFPYSATKSRTGRHLMSDINPPSSGEFAGNKYEAIKKFGEIHSEIFHDLAVGMIYLKENFGEDFDIIQHAALLRNMSKINIVTLKKLYGRQLLVEANEFRDLLQAKAKVIVKLQESSTLSAEPHSALEKIINIVTCISKYNDTYLEDNLEWLECLFDCEDLPPIATCVQNAFTNCKDVAILGETSWVGSLVVQGFSSLVGLNEQCHVKVSTPELTIEEGGDPGYLELRTFLPPPIMCYDINKLNSPMDLIVLLVQFISRSDGEKWCNPEIQISTSNYLDEVVPYIDILGIGKPKCRNGSLLSQAAIGWHENAVNHSGRIIITADNWNMTYRVPLYGVIDGKQDGDQELSVSIKMVVNNEIKKTARAKVIVKDKDPGTLSTCRSLNDPHVITFDGHYYNNHFEGYFTLYEHMEEQYKVQAIYQRCEQNSNGTCNCAVAVQSGDDVIVIDKCQRRSRECSGDSACAVPTKVKAFINGNLTSGTKVLRKRDGMEIDVVLPHGTHVQVYEIMESLNVFIRPSANDWLKTKGLCGLFNGQPNDDLTLPNGTVYAGEGSESKGQPKPFNNAWRVPSNESIFQGVQESESTTNSTYCRCQYVIIEGVQCECGPNLNVETCDIEGQDITANVSIFATKSLVQLARLNPKQGQPEDDVIIDFNHNPEDGVWPTGGNWTKANAEAVCQTKFKSGEDKMLAKCSSSDWMNDFTYLNTYEGSCIEDIKLTDSDRWITSAQQGARAHCLDAIDRMIDRQDEDFREIRDLDCINSCNNQGNCSAGVCQCESGFTGPDCSMEASANPQIFSGRTFCDTRYMDCSYANLYGQNLLPQYQIECQFTQQQNTFASEVDSSDVTKASVFYLTPGHLACPLPSPTGNYRITITYKKNYEGYTLQEQNSNAEITSVQFDSMCFTCDLNTGSCERRNDGGHCFIAGKCLAPGEASPDDSCKVCDPKVSSSEYQDKQDDVCKKKLEDQEAETRNRNIRIGVSVGLCVIVVVGTIILYVCIGRREEEKVMAIEGGVGNQGFDLSGDKGPNGGDVQKNIPGQTIQTSSFTSQPTGESSNAPESKLPAPPVGEAGNYEDIYHTVHIPGPEQNSGVADVSTKDLVEIVRRQQVALQSSRSRTNSGSSVKSIGIGAVGPVGFATYATYDTIEQPLFPASALLASSSVRTSQTLPTEAPASTPATVQATSPQSVKPEYDVSRF